MLEFITEKLNKRLSGWFAKTLSLGGKEVLIKSIAMALPVYAMSCFRLTKHQCQKITSAISSFWWNSCEGKMKIHWVAWKEMCTSKDNGGLGFRDISDFNQSLLAKQAWKILNEPTSLLSRVYKGRYFAKTEFLNCGKGYRPSYAWRSILFGKDLLQRGLLKSIGNGGTTRVWTEKWIMDSQPRVPINKQSMLDYNLLVSDLLMHDLTWNITRVHELFLPMEAMKILKMMPVQVDDRYIWAFNETGSYSVKSGCWLLANNPTIQRQHRTVLENIRIDTKKRIWLLQTAPRIKIFLWRVISGALAVADRLRTRGLLINQVCKLCNQGNETISHVLFQCITANRIWHIGKVRAPSNGYGISLEENMMYVLNLMEDARIASETRLAIPWLLWCIWKNRNAVIYADTQEALETVVARSLEEAKHWFLIKAEANSNGETTSNGIRNDSRWLPPLIGIVKCNIHANWRNASLHSGVAWITRDHKGWVTHHSREALTFSPNRLIAELRCVIWAMQGLRDLRLQNVIIAMDYTKAFEAISKPNAWPRYRFLLNLIESLRNDFYCCSLELETQSSNLLARDIAKSVLRDGRLQSYLMLGGPSWLQERIARESFV